MYGGIVVDEADAKSLAEEVLKIKVMHGLPKTRPIKWNNERWGGVVLDKNVHSSVKDAVLTLFSESPAKLIVCLSPHKFYHSPAVKGDGRAVMSIEPESLVRSHKYGINDLMHKFDEYVGAGNYGLVLADRFGTAVKSEMDRHCTDLFPSGGGAATSRYVLRNIALPVIQVDNEESYLHQINDVVLGAIQISFKEMGHNFLPRLRNNFWSTDHGPGIRKVTGNGFNIYPVKATQEWCRVAKVNLQAKFIRLINE